MKKIRSGPSAPHGRMAWDSQLLNDGSRAGRSISGRDAGLVWIHDGAASLTLVDATDVRSIVPPHVSAALPFAFPVGPATINGLDAGTYPGLGFPAGTNTYVWTTVDGGATWSPASGLAGGVTISGTASSGAVPIASSSSAAAWTVPSGDCTWNSSGVLTCTQAQGGAVTFSGAGNVGANSIFSSSGTVAGTGFIKEPNNTTIVAARNAANSADIGVLATDGSNDVILGNSNSSDVKLRPGGTLALDSASSGNTLAGTTTFSALGAGFAQLSSGGVLSSADITTAQLQHSPGIARTTGRGSCSARARKAG